MYKLLQISRNLVYYHLNKEVSLSISDELIIKNDIKDIFRRDRNNYGPRKIKIELEKLGYQCLKKIYLELCRTFDNRNKLEVAVSNLTYVRVGGKWNYICTLIDLYNKEIIGYVAGDNKNIELTETTLLRYNYPLKDISIFHSDRGNEYDNLVIDSLLDAFAIDRSLSNKGNPYDNAVSESTNKTMKDLYWKDTLKSY